MTKSKAGRFIQETTLAALKGMEPGDYMHYKDESGKMVWMAAAPETWPSGEVIIVNLESFECDLIGKKLSCQKKIKAGFKARQSYQWTGFLKMGNWSWEA